MTVFSSSDIKLTCIIIFFIQLLRAPRRFGNGREIPRCGVGALLPILTYRGRTSENAPLKATVLRLRPLAKAGLFASLKGTDPFAPSMDANLKTEAAQNAPNLNALKNGISSKQALKTAQNLLANGHATPVKMQSSHFFTRIFPTKTRKNPAKIPSLRSKEKPPAHNLRRLICGRDTLCAADFRKPRGRLAGKS